MVSAAPFYFEDREALVTEDWKYVRWLVSGREDLYDLRADPAEMHNVAGADEDRMSRVRALLDQSRADADQLRSTWRIRVQETAEIDPATKESLRSLGYVD